MRIFFIVFITSLVTMAIPDVSAAFNKDQWRIERHKKEEVYMSCVMQCIQGSNISQPLKDKLLRRVK